MSGIKIMNYKSKAFYSKLGSKESNLGCKVGMLFCIYLIINFLNKL